MIYFDNAATTAPCAAAVKAAERMFENYGNPSSLHRLGLTASQAVSSARKIVARSIAADEGEIFFTSGATESNNTAIFGAAKSIGRHKKKVVVSAVEHPSAAKCCDLLADNGFEVLRIPPTEDMARQFISAVDNDTCLCVCMLCNNETGAFLPVSDIFRAVKKKYPRVHTHCDAVQAYLKIPLRADKLCADTIALSGHKVHALKGIGVLYAKKGVHIPPLLYGGGQEKGVRSGTESVPLIAAMGAAVEQLCTDIDDRFRRVGGLSEHLRSRCLAEGITLNSPDGASPYINSIALAGYRSEVLLHFLESRDIFVSSGSACSKGKKSGVLAQFSVPDTLADSTLRISFCADNTIAETDELIDALKAAKRELLAAN